jgi:hypothetical protein
MKGKLALVLALVSVGLASDSEFLMNYEAMKNYETFSSSPYPTESSVESNSFIQTTRKELGWLSHASNGYQLNENAKGRWLTDINVPDGYYACGFRIMYDIGSWKIDNSGIKEIELVWCSFGNPQVKDSQLLTLKLIPNFKANTEAEKMLMCPNNSRITGFNLKYEWTTDREDNVGATGIAIECSSGGWVSHDETWGNWFENWLKLNNSNYYICGAVVKYQPKEEYIKQDETRVNLIALKGCSL